MHSDYAKFRQTVVEGPAVVVRQSLSFEPPPFLAAANGDTAAAWAVLLAACTSPATTAGCAPAGAAPTATPATGQSTLVSVNVSLSAPARSLDLGTARPHGPLLQGSTPPPYPSPPRWCWTRSAAWPRTARAIRRTSPASPPARAASPPTSLQASPRRSLPSERPWPDKGRPHMHLQDPALPFATYQAFGF